MILDYCAPDCYRQHLRRAQAALVAETHRRTACSGRALPARWPTRLHRGDRPARHEWL